MKIRGNIYQIEKEKVYSETFKKREFVIKDDSKYPQLIKLELQNANCDKLDNYKIGEPVTVEFDLRGKEWRNQNTNEIVFFNSLVAWKIERDNTPNSVQMPELPNTPGPVEEETLPF